jgi:tripartite-type tricarboxylate transporter receptor subunit TctC
MLGTKMKVVPGYEGHGDVFPALERDEVQGYNNSLAGTISSNPEYIKNGTLNVVIQFGRNRAAQIPDVPTAIEIAPNEADKNTLSFYAAKYELAYALIAPPGVPEDRVKALEAAFDATMKDPQYLSAAEKIRLSVDPLNAAQVAKIIDSIEKAPQAVIDRMREMMTPRPAN